MATCWGAIEKRPESQFDHFLAIVHPVPITGSVQSKSLKKYKKLPTYRLISNTGPRHKPVFKVGVKLFNTKFYSAIGKSKKDAEQNAALLCLQNIKKVWCGTI